MLKTQKPAGAWQATRRAGQRTGVDSTRTYSTSSEPVALAVWKRGRWCTVAKLTCLDGGNHELILAIVHRNQQGTTSRVSFTLSTIRYAREHGVSWVYFRRDTTGEMWRTPLAELERCPLGPSVGGKDAERYVEIASMERVAWCDWRWAASVVRLGAEPEPEGRQMSLFGGLL